MFKNLAHFIHRLTDQRAQKKFQVQQAQLFANAFAEIDGYQLSKASRKELSDEPAYFYGEIVFESFKTLLAQAEPQPNETFWDLGMGTGKAVITAAITRPFKAVYGVELLEPLYQASLQAKAQLLEYPSMLQCNTIHLSNGCLLQAPWQNADVLFINGTCFIGPLWQQLEQRLNKLKSGARVILVSKQLKTPLFRQLYHDLVWMSWGWANTFIYQKMK